MELPLGILYNVCFVSCYIPQIRKILKTKSARDVSTLLFWITIVGYISASGYAFIRYGFDPLLHINYFMGMCGALYILFLCYKYRS